VTPPELERHVEHLRQLCIEYGEEDDVNPALEPWQLLHDEECPRYGKVTPDATSCTCSPSVRGRIERVFAEQSAAGVPVERTDTAAATQQLYDLAYAIRAAAEGAFAKGGLVECSHAALSSWAAAIEAAVAALAGAKATGVERTDTDALVEKVREALWRGYHAGNCPNHEALTALEALAARLERAERGRVKAVNRAEHLAVLAGRTKEAERERDRAAEQLVDLRRQMEELRERGLWPVAKLAERLEAAERERDALSAAHARDKPRARVRLPALGSQGHDAGREIRNGERHSSSTPIPQPGRFAATPK
jgi:hypothetical protein